jgi:hypothetical protein
LWGILLVFDNFYPFPAYKRLGIKEYIRIRPLQSVVPCPEQFHLLSLICPHANLPLLRTAEGLLAEISRGISAKGHTQVSLLQRCHTVPTEKRLLFIFL